jgi:hypothetical protein
VAQPYIHIQESYIIPHCATSTFRTVMPAMTRKNAALLALIGTILITALLVWDYVLNVLNVLRGLIPATMLFSSFIYAFACFSVAVFSYVFHKAKT